MKKNMGTLDRSIRTVIAVIIGILYFTGQISGTPATILIIIAIIFLLTSIISWCPAYTLFGFSTKK